MKRTHDVVSIIGAVALCCTLGFLSAPAAAQSVREGVIYLDPAWSEDDRTWYYNFSQGATVMSYDIFLNLEAADSQEHPCPPGDTPRAN